MVFSLTRRDTEGTLMREDWDKCQIHVKLELDKVVPGSSLYVYFVHLYALSVSQYFAFN